MKVQKAFSVLATLSILSFTVACNDRYQEGLTAGQQQGYSQGYDVGYDDGFTDGDEAGYKRAREYFASADYNAGFADGRAEGVTVGYNQGYTVGQSNGLAEGYNNGYNDGDADGFTRGYDVGYDDGYADGGAGAFNQGYSLGYSEGYDDGAADGYDLGYNDGYDVGYDDGWYDAGGLSIGKTPKLAGYADVLSAFHNDLINYKNIPAPKQTKKGLVANGRLILSEVSMTNKDTLKRVAAMEQYLVVEMAKQVKGKFGLSAERSLKVAKAANHFRKFSTKRALTAEDTNAYASEIIGVNFTAIEKAYQSSLKGETSELSSILEKAAEKNGVSPEQMGSIMAKMFL